MLEPGETVQVETYGGHDQDYLAKKDLRAGAVMDVDPYRYSRPCGPFHIEGIEAGDWVSVEILDMEVGPYGFYRNGGPHWGSVRLIAPVRGRPRPFPARLRGAGAAHDRRRHAGIGGTPPDRYGRQHGFQLDTAGEHGPHLRAETGWDCCPWATCTPGWGTAS